MKIGIVCPYSIDRHGGVLEHILNVRDNLVQRGHSVKIITPKPRGRGNHEPPEGVIFIGTSTDFRTLTFSETTSQVSSTADAERIDAILNEEKFDILHFHEPWNPLLSRQLLQRSTAVNIGTFHSKVSETISTRALLRIVYPYLKSVMQYLHVLTAVSNAGAEYVTTITDEPITLIPNGIDLDKYHFKPHVESAADPTVLYIGRLEGRKGVKYLLQAAQVLQQDHPNMRLIIAGDGPDRERLELLAEDLHLHNVSFLGFVSEELKQQLLTEADIFCSPAVSGESFGIVLLEAMATGTVTVAGNNPGYADLMQGIGALSIINPRDTEEFARRLNTLLTETDLRKLWQDWAKTYVQEFSYDRVVDQYEALYKEALKQHGRSSHK
ncbi:MAG TPA: glycosyltransferase family 4 protein [Candidatus Saccharimonadales bacterium]|nr:glycosyltransferase family 4 protein [Candidatus Saccharimonadales bacterium]